MKRVRVPVQLQKLGLEEKLLRGRERSALSLGPGGAEPQRLTLPLHRVMQL